MKARYPDEIEVYLLWALGRLKGTSMAQFDDTTPGRKGEWMQLSTGGRFYPLDPRPEEIDIRDIANGLALDCRYGGQGNTDRFYSVAEHCTLMARWAAAQGSEFQFCRAVLLHDAAEAYINDFPRAVKHAVEELGGGYGALETLVQNAVWKRFRLEFTAEMYADHIKRIDRRIVPLEKEAVFGHVANPWAYDQFTPLNGVKICCWSPSVAKAEFLGTFIALGGHY